MAREQSYTDDEEMEEEPEEEEELPAPPSPPASMRAKQPVAKKPMHVAKPVPKVEVPQVQYVRTPIFESAAQQIVYDLLLQLDARLAKVNEDLELMKKYLPKD